MRRSPRLQEKRAKAAAVKTPDKSDRMESENSPVVVSKMEIDSPNKDSPSKVDNRTALAYEERCVLHRCMDERDHPERPERIKRIFDKLTEDGLVDRCTRVISRPATLEEVQLVHDEKYVKEFMETKDMEIDDLRLWQDKWNSIYACHDTYEATLLACGTLLECVAEVVSGKATNGAAVIRPPGHHAESDEAYGFCFFNNVAVAAQYARKMLGVGKILILDWDVHHGNGVQSAFYNDPNVLYISLHRYDHGRFFPVNASNGHTDIGEGTGRGFNINIPWNGRGMGDGEYLEAFKQIVMPVAYEFMPELVLVSAGYDAARGDPLGGYRVTPGGYAQMTKLLCQLADGRVVLALEGGYNLTSISESMAACVRVLLGEEPMEPDEPVKPCSKGALETIGKVKDVLQEFWHSLAPPEEKDANKPAEVQIDETIASAQSTVEAIEKLIVSLNMQLKINVGNRTGSTAVSDSSKTALIFEQTISSKHFSLWDPNHIECPARLASILKKITERRLIDRCLLLPPRKADVSEICSYHDMDMVEKVSETPNWDVNRLEEFCNKLDDVYINKDTYEAALISAGSTIDAVKAILDGNCNNAMALVRPPGHHACKALDELNGFCIFNNVVLATKIALDVYKLNRILIVDWDVHHGQGTQRPFYQDNRVLYFSIHGYENGTFWPNLRESHWDFIGSGPGKGYNVNVPLNSTGMGDGEYLAIFNHILLPLAADFDPELIIISAGYDAAIGCPEGLMQVSPLCYAHLTRMLMPFANGRVCAVLEGGYWLDSLAEGAAMTLRSLLGDQCPQLPSTFTKPIHPSLTEVLLGLVHALQDTWPSMRAIRTGVNSVMAKLERPPYTPAVPVYNWTPADKVAYEIRDKLFSARPTETVEYYRNVVDEMMGECWLGRCQWKLTIAASKFDDGLNGLYGKLKDDNLVKAVRINVEDSSNASQVLDEQPTGEEKSNADKTISVELCLKAVKAMCDRETQCGMVLLDNVAPDRAIVDVAKHAKGHGGMKRVLVIDFHVQCRDNISREFYKDDSVLVVSMHRKDSWARTEFGHPENVGNGPGAGYNVNLIWNGKTVADAEDLFAFHRIIVPIAYAFNPDLVIISLELPQVHISPAVLAYFIHQMQTLADGKLLILIKSDTLNDAAQISMVYSCIKSLLSTTLPADLQFNCASVPVSPNSIPSYMETVFYLRPYWPYFQCLLAPNPTIGNAIDLNPAMVSDIEANNLAEFLQIQAQLGVGSMFIGVPSPNCPHMQLEGVCANVPHASQIDMATPCGSCGNVGENWICLTCWKVYCSRYVNEHALVHGTASGHPIALSMADLSTWCYMCDSYIRSEILTPAKRALHLAKFGVDIPNAQ